MYNKQKLANFSMRVLFFILLLALGCVNISNVGGDVRDEICVGEKYNEYSCYFGTSINKEECLEYGYGQNKGSSEFSYFEDINCQEFCNGAYDSGLECTIIVFK